MSNTRFIEIEGFPELQAKIQKLPDKVKKREILKILGQVANTTVKVAKQKVKVSKKKHIISGKNREYKVIEPGNLKKSIGKIRGKKGLAKQNAVLYVGPRSKGRKNDGWYGVFLEYGTVKQKAQPFLRPAYQQTRGKVSADATKKVAKYIQKQIQKLSS